MKDREEKKAGEVDNANSDGCPNDQDDPENKTSRKVDSLYPDAFASAQTRFINRKCKTPYNHIAYRVVMYAF